MKRGGVVGVAYSQCRFFFFSLHDFALVERVVCAWRRYLLKLIYTHTQGNRPQILYFLSLYAFQSCAYILGVLGPSLVSTYALK